MTTKQLARLLLPAAALAVAGACSDAPSAPAAPRPTPAISPSEPPPPPITGRIIYDAPLGEDVGAFFTLNTTTTPPAPEQTTDDPFAACTLPPFCVPGIFTRNVKRDTEYLLFVPEELLPADVQRQLLRRGAACGIGPKGETIYCPVWFLFEGIIVNNASTGRSDGTGVAYDVSQDRRFVVTVNLDQIDRFSGKGLDCNVVDAAAVVCTTPPVIGELWVGTQADRTGRLVYTRRVLQASPFKFTAALKR